MSITKLHPYWLNDNINTMVHETRERESKQNDDNDDEEMKMNDNKGEIK